MLALPLCCMLVMLFRCHFTWVDIAFFSLVGSACCSTCPTPCSAIPILLFSTLWVAVVLPFLHLLAFCLDIFVIASSYYLVSSDCGMPPKSALNIYFAACRSLYLIHTVCTIRTCLVSLTHTLSLWYLQCSVDVPTYNPDSECGVHVSILSGVTWIFTVHPNGDSGSSL